MKAYLLTTATAFVLLTITHIARAFQELHLAREPWFIVATVVPCMLAIWAVTLLRRIPRS